MRPRWSGRARTVLSLPVPDRPIRRTVRSPVIGRPSRRAEYRRTVRGPAPWPGPWVTGVRLGEPDSLALTAAADRDGPPIAAGGGRRGPAGPRPGRSDACYSELPLAVLPKRAGQRLRGSRNPPGFGLREGRRRSDLKLSFTEPPGLLAAEEALTKVMKPGSTVLSA